MSYPKAINRSKSEQRLFDKAKKQEQIKTILINKFRNKYGIKADIDQLDLILRNEVTTLIATNDMSDASLRRIDKKI
jgi:hypothetical protein